MHSQPGALNRFFSGITEFAFQTQLGVADPDLVDYISNMLVRFLHTDTHFQVRDVQGRPLTHVADMLTEAEQRVGTAKRDVHRHIGDYTLFWAGLYPEALGDAEEGNSDYVMHYCQQGKRAYWIASTIDSEGSESKIQPEVLERLSSQFELCAYGLKEVRNEWERRDDGSGTAPFLIN
ncbi:MAG: hypothetical protein AAGF97_08295 [Planctomycetota bacterium]